MSFTISDAQLRSMPATEREGAIRRMEAATRAPVNGEIKELDAQLGEFERVHGFSTAEMHQRLRNGSLRETESVCRWSMLADLRNRLAARR
jgi:hypothetical protein